jgi:hypothetical protein
MIFRSKYDHTGESQKMGQSAESLFEDLARQKNLNPIKATKKQQISHIDFILTAKNNLKYFVDVKARKKSCRSDSKVDDELVWVEFKNVSGNKGWLYGAADYIAFEREDDFIIVSRLNLITLCDRLINKNLKTNTSKEALYKVYSRIGRNDEISMIKMQDILKNIKTTIWKKSQQI